ncbi:helix-turn-helix domain-containing protein [Cryobacterium tepidiphilum]|uniref:helix-turn-helix domain-containing protein n=1 Tax=Cryobacterium tepidiphilum TaxID=2486026 RepID=UPI001F2064F3|nr:helix-turn-helix domain-containing protein [Cryobacterium tepidiphilum]
MAPVLRNLLDNDVLELTLLTPEPELPPGVLDVGVAWVHSSDLLDPTPFLDQGHVLLITGTQFDAATTDAEYAGYVGRLAARRVAGLGFGTEVIRNGTPVGLRLACLEAGLPLFEVPYRTPFIAIARFAADLVAEETYARRTWALKAQRAISLAALRPNGLAATLAELSHQLGHWVALYDATGALDRVFPSTTPRHLVAGAVHSEAVALLRKGRRAGSAIVVDGETLTLQTLGRGESLRGVLAVGGASGLDDAGHQVVTSVIALAGLALEQNHELDYARSLLRAGLWHALLSGDVELARTVVRQMWGDLPREPVRVGIIAGDQRTIDTLSESLDLRVADQPGTLFYAPDGATVIVCVGRDAADLPEALADSFDVTMGVSDEAPYSQLHRAREQAAHALARAHDSGERVVAFSSIARQGMLAFLAHADAQEIGRATLAPLIRHDEVEGTALVESLRVWLEENGHIERAAARLGVHRHTMRARIGDCERVLGYDLGSFHARADLWAALLALGAPSRES